MRKIEFSANVHARLETIWDVMLDRVEHPAAVVVKEVRILERGDHYLVREVRSRWLLIQERVIINQGSHQITFKTEEHPHLRGSAVLRAVPLSRQSPVAPVRVTMTLEWMPKSEEAELAVLQTLPAEIQQEVLSIKDEAESNDAE